MSRSFFKQFKTKVPKAGKIKNVQRTHFKGFSFASKAESTMYATLLLEERAGLIKDIRLQKHVKLTKAEITYIPDFVVFDIALNQDVYIEVKGFETDVWRIKRRLWIHYGPGPLKVFKLQKQNLVLFETITPKININESLD